jgi:hypothetical protein
MQLIVGWGQKSTVMIEEYSEYLMDGSGIDLVVTETTEEMKKEFAKIQQRHPAIKMRLMKADIDNEEVMAKLKPEQYDNVIILAGDHGEAELKDSETIAKLLEFRHYFRKLGLDTIKTQLITEVADSENTEVIQETGVRDFLISNQFVSKIYAQVSEEPDVLEVYEDLFKEEGSEVYLKPVTLFLKEIPGSITFGDLCAAALARSESCFGVRIASEHKNPDKNYGIYINPQKKETFALMEKDFLITLAEDET